MTNFHSVGGRAIESNALRVAVHPLIQLIYLWMGFGLLVTALVSTLTAANALLRQLLTNELVVYGALIAELVLVGVLSTQIHRMSFRQAAMAFASYAASNGFTLGIVFLVFNVGSITAAFVTTAALFAAMAVVGFVTDLDLTRYRTYFLMGLIGLLLALVVNHVISSRPFDLVMSIIGVMLFAGLTAYDTQKIKQLAADPDIQASGSLTLKLSLLGALVLYLDFINLFLYLLRFFGASDE